MAEATFYTSVLASVAGASKHHLTLWNAVGSPVTVKLYKIYAAGAPTAAVVGLVLPLVALRISTQPTGGTVPVIGKAANSDAAVNANVVARAAPGNVLTDEGIAFGSGTVSGEETAPGSQGVALYEFKIDGAKPIDLIAGQGITIKQGALASAGAVNIIIVFTTV